MSMLSVISVCSDTLLVTLGLPCSVMTQRKLYYSVSGSDEMCSKRLGMHLDGERLF